MAHSCMQSSADKALDRLQEPLSDWAALRSNLRITRRVKFLQRCAPQMATFFSSVDCAKLPAWDTELCSTELDPKRCSGGPPIWTACQAMLMTGTVGWLGRFVHLPTVGRYAQRAFLTKLEDIAVMALAFCHSHEITLRDLETYGVLQVSPPTNYSACLLQT